MCKYCNTPLLGRMEEHQKELCRMLGLGTGLIGQASNKLNSWAEIYEAIGKLKERAEKPQKEIVHFPSTNPTPLGYGQLGLYRTDPNLHYHNGNPCRNNHCVWC